MEWISFHGPRRPINGQKIIYYGEPIGVWRGHYMIDYKDPYCKHLIICDESLGVVDYLDAPYWQPDEGQPKPPPPEKPYPDDYPA